MLPAALQLGILPVLLGGAASVATLAGGLLALRLGKRTNIVMGVTAGIVLGVSLFDLVPEALSIGASHHAPRTLLAALAAGLVVYMVLDRSLSGAVRGGGLRAHMAPASLTIHSLVDGLGIGLAFQVSTSFGGAVTAAVLAHDMSDGMNVVGLCLSNRRIDHARRWLVADAAAPLCGVLIAQYLHVPASILALILAVFAGMFLYIGACELLPRSYVSQPSMWTTASTVAGLLLMFAVVTLAER